MNSIDQQDCIATATQFFWHLDHNRYPELMALMTPDAVWFRQGLELTPGDEMLATLQRRSPTRRVVHLLSNLTVWSSVEGHARVTGYLTSYAHDPGVPINGPAPLGGPGSILALDIEMKRQDDRWFVDRSRTHPLFRRETSTEA